MSPGVHRRTPPSTHAMRCLSRASREPFPVQEINFSVRDKLLLFGYVQLVDTPSPYKTHKPGATVPYLHVTQAGLDALNVWADQMIEKGVLGWRKL